ncbi:hypothetical protein QRD44_11830 [Pseudomonas plecoglossicida]|uniref:Uncharacterized protein n=2 Tax=Pseudomonas plecoglossicida TaxID=70775 RepID=A0AAD0R1I8_PSEDL|nr:hypothetical protein [Pseudomonas plecoglossicida]AXM98643.1 hypothetical protein DVB73_24030 [Pseudomonas plecoglossicida]EPB95053.1 hypothetical protein L321_14451 [Pseudomonas plecoglossicida NB2011]QLB54789.1 hypothetical protein HAV28_08040 [Pseudomonas plecoglossicida]GLR34669.1 hypothetical protein GCM10011247_00660 [Pseudomonas plecoglossicida]
MLLDNRQNMELDKLQLENRKLTAEAKKFSAEAHKLRHEALCYPVIVGSAFTTAIAAIINLVLKY